MKESARINLIVELEKQLKCNIESAFWHHARWLEAEKRVIDLKETIAGLRDFL